MSRSGCFNCGSTEHSLHACPLPRDYAQINEARDAWRDREPAASGSNLRLHESEAAIARQLDFIDRFRPGTISNDLRYALGFSQWSTDFPYLHRFLTFGYPPAYWVREGAPTPQERMRARLLSRESEESEKWELVDLLKMEEEIAPFDGNSKATTTAAYTFSPRKGLRQADPNARLVKSVYYQTSLFDSDRLPCCFPDRLPDLVRTDAPPVPAPPASVIPAVPPIKIPPWRLPGAFGPAPVLSRPQFPSAPTQIKRQRLEEVEAVDADMDLSD